MKKHLAEMILDYKLHGPSDQFRKRQGFSEDIEATQAVLFNPRYDKRRKIRGFLQWLEINQPCVFGRVAAKNKNVFVCLLEEHEVLRMRRGDEDLRDTIQDYRQAWKRHALEGLSSSFLILLVSRALVTKEPNEQLKQICRRLMELYMEIEPIRDDTYRTQREYVFLRLPHQDDPSTILSFSTLPNIFCSHGDGRWWHDHRTPGGILITSNALGHFAYSRKKSSNLETKDKLKHLENAMRTINNAYKGGPNQKAKLKHCPATYLIPNKEGEASPLWETSSFRNYSADHYEGYFHTDHLIPSVYFKKDRDPKELKRYDSLTFRYIYDPEADPEEHAELMTGIKTKAYDLKRNMDRLPEFVDPERVSDFSAPVRGRLAQWLEQRLKHRLGL